VVTDFAAFGAPKSSSVFGTAVAPTPFSLAGGKAALAACVLERREDSMKMKMKMMRLETSESGIERGLDIT
jgi:hypothetical protein